MADKCWLCEGKGTYFDEGTFPCPECNIKETKGYMVAAARIHKLEAALADKDVVLEKAMKGWEDAVVLILQTSRSHNEKYIDNRNQFNDTCILSHFTPKYFRPTETLKTKKGK